MLWGTGSGSQSPGTLQGSVVTSALARNQVLVGFWAGFVTLLMTFRRDGYLQIQGHQECKEVVGMGETAAGATQEAGLGRQWP